MRKQLMRGALIGVCLVWTASAAQAAEGIRWARSYPAAQEEAKKTNRLIMADFYTDWCGYCKKLDNETYPDKRVVQLASQVVSVRVNAEKEGAQLARTYGVRGFPTILFLTSSGRIAGQITGFLPAAAFAGEMERVIQSHRDFPLLQARFKKNPADVEAGAKLTLLYAAQGDPAQAATTLAQIEKADPKNSKGYLPRAYNAVADMYQLRRQFDKAIPLFRKAVATGKTPMDVAYAQISIAFCYLPQQKYKEAAAALNATLRVPNAPADLKKHAEFTLQKMKQQGLTR